MSEYSRKISYIYEYKDGLKSENKGFIKTEVRDNKGSMDIELRNLDKTEMSPVTIGYYLWENNRIKACGYDKKRIVDKNASLHMEFNVEDIEGANVHEIGGVIIWGDNRIYSAEWTEEGFDPGKIDKVDSLKKIMIVQEEPTVKTITQVFNNLEKKLVKQPADKMQIVEEKVQTAVNSIQMQTEPENIRTLNELENSEQAEEIFTAQEIPDFLKVKKKEKNNRIKYEKSYHMKINNWKDFFKKYDIVEPFSDDVIFNCVEIGYDDLKFLPSSCNNVRNNSFLLHGLYNYNHILVARYRCRRRQQIYVLGVPGRYDNNQKIIASMFGFDNFKIGRRGQIKDKNFGYWYTMFKDDED